MTRDEAAKKVRDASPVWGSGDVLVDSLVALGLLKLDEHKSSFQKLCCVLTDWRNADTEGANAFMNRIEAAGLKIVEK